MVRLRVQMHDAQGVELQPESDLTYSRFYTVTHLAAGKVVLDGNHPLAGIALRFSCRVISVRTAKAEEIRRGVSLP